jgi:hypothetical protein
MKAIGNLNTTKILGLDFEPDPPEFKIAAYSIITFVIYNEECSLSTEMDGTLNFHD